MLIRLKRKWETERSTIGQYAIEGTNIKGYMLERPGPDTLEAGLRKRVPEGTYQLCWHIGEAFQNVLKLYNSEVPKERAILIHIGNYPRDTDGCLLPGLTRETDVVWNSGTAMKRIRDHVKSIGFEGSGGPQNNARIRGGATIVIENCFEPSEG